MSQIGLNIGVWNADGLANKALELELFVKCHNIDIMLVSETHFCSRLHGYDIHQATHPADRKRVGSAILLQSCLQYYKLYSLQSPNIQCVAIKAKTDLGKTDNASIYCPPNFQCIANDFEKLFDDLETSFIIAGDWNAHQRLWGSRNSSTRGRALADFILTTGDPYSQRTPTAIDFAVYRGTRPESLSISESLELSSDHIPLIGKLRVAAQKTSRRACILPRNASLPRFQEAVNRLVNLNMVLRSPDAINDAVELLVRDIHIAAESSTSSSRPSSPPQAPLKPEIMDLVRLERSLRCRYMRS